MLPIQALSIRMWVTMFPPSSATAIFIGCPISLAFFSAALITRRASSSFTADIDSSLQLFYHIVWRPEVRELVQQVTVRPDLIRNFSVRVDREEKIDNVVRRGSPCDHQACTRTIKCFPENGSSVVFENSAQ